MINKRLLIKNLLSHNSENSFFDKKQKLSLSSKEGKAKFLKHICALSNTNPNNNSFIVIGVEDIANKILGVDFFDDSKIQNLVNAYLKNAPKIQYENIAFPRLPRHKVVGLVTIYPNHRISSLLKNIWKYRKNTIFYRRGSNSMPFLGINFQLRSTNQAIVAGIEKNATNNIEHTLHGVFDFMNNHKAIYNPQYKVFNEQFVLCWAGQQKTINTQEYFSRVDIELVNEQVRLFYSALDDVQIRYNSNSFIITEHILIGTDSNENYYPLEKTIINFKTNGKHDIVTEFLFKPPKYDANLIHHIYMSSNEVVRKIQSKKTLTSLENQFIKKLPNNYLLCYLNGFSEAIKQLKKIKNYLKNNQDKITYIKYKEAMRIIRKVKYN
jgi:hypothetical protein